MERILELRALVNRQLESCRASGALGASLEAQVHLALEDGEAAAGLAAALQWLQGSAHPSVDNLADWLLVSALQLHGTGLAAPGAEVLAETNEAGLHVQIAKADGQKCERCWHYETDIGQHSAHPSLCGRCVAVLD